MPGTESGSEERIERVLRDQVEQVASPEQADEVLREAEQLTAGESQQERADRVTNAAPTAAGVVERAASASSDEAAVAKTLAATTAAALSEKPDAAAAQEAVRETLSVSAERATPEARRGQALLKDAALRQMGPLEAIDARVFLAVNGVPHPHWLDAAGYALAVITTGGWIWVLGTLGAYLLRRPRALTALKLLLPGVVGATAIVEHVVKSYFRRRRPFIDLLRALVVGRKPGGWSFPSGHTASSFACARVLSTVWPRRSPLFYALASLVGLSRVYVGAHYPGDVLFGAAIGTCLAELFRRAARRVFQT